MSKILSIMIDFNSIIALTENSPGGPVKAHNAMSSSLHSKSA